MLLFITIFFAMVIVVGTVMIFGFSVFLKSRRKSLDTNDSRQFADALPYRSLFEPDEAEIRRVECRDKTEKAAHEVQQIQLAGEVKAAQAEICLEKWRVSPDKSQTVELLKAASDTENARIFSEIAETVIQVWREYKITNLNRADLADLLDSHLNILPQQERFSGTVFWLKDEIKKLREKSE